VGILVTFVPPKVTARRGMSDMPPCGTAATPKRNATQSQSHRDNSQPHSANTKTHSGSAQLNKTL